MAWTCLVFFYFVFSACLYFPALGTSYFLYGTDTVAHDYIMHLYGWNSILKDGRLPLWNPYIFYGLPFIGTFALCPFYPSQWLYFLLPHNTAFTMQYVLALTVGATTTAIWLKTLRVRFSVAAWTGLALIVSGHFLTLTYAGHLQKMIAIAWAPGAWAACTILLRGCLVGLGHLRRNVCILALCLTMQLLASHTQIFYGTLFVCFMQVIVIAFPLVLKAWTAPDPGLAALIRTPQVRALWRILKYFSAVIILIGLFSSSQIFHSYEIAGVSNRGGSGLSYAEASDTSYPPRELTEYALARFWGDSVVDPQTNRPAGTAYTGQWGERIVSDFLGIPLLLLALVSLIGARSKYGYFLLGILAFATLLGLGANTPFHRLCFALLPGFDRFRSPGTWMFLSNFALLGLAAFGLEELLRRANQWQSPDSVPLSQPRLLKITQLFLSLATAAGAATALIYFWQNLGVRVDIATSEEVAVYVRNRMTAGIGLEIALACGLLNLALSAGKTRNHLSPKLRSILSYSGWLFAVLAVTVPLNSNSYFIRFGFLDRYLDYLNYQKPFQEMKKVHNTPKRILEDRRLKIDQMLHGIASQEGYHPVILAGYSKMINAAGFNTERFGQLMGVNYARTGTGVPPPGNWQPMYTTLRDSMWRWLGTPRPYVHNNINLQPTQDEKALTELIEKGRATDFGISKTIVEQLSLQAGQQNVVGNVLTWRPGYVVLNVVKLSTAVPELLPIAEPYAPGWRAKLADGTKLKITPVNLGMIGIILPPGDYEQNLILSYDPMSLRLGIFLTWFSIFAAVFLQGSRISSYVRKRWNRRP